MQGIGEMEDLLELGGLCEVDEVLCPVATCEDGLGRGRGGSGGRCSRASRHCTGVGEICWESGRGFLGCLPSWPSGHRAPVISSPFLIGPATAAVPPVAASVADTQHCSMPIALSYILVLKFLLDYPIPQFLAPVMETTRIAFNK